MKRHHEIEELALRLEELKILEAMPVGSIKEVEQRMVMIYHDYAVQDIEQYAAECIETLKRERWRLLYDRFEWTDENVARLAAMNERMKTALLDMRRKTIEVYESLSGWRTSDKDVDVSGTLWVTSMNFEGWETDEDMRDSLFDIMTCKPYCGSYGTNGVSGPYNLCSYNIPDQVLEDSAPDNYETENQMLYLSENPFSWNEMMNPERTDHLNLVYGVHNLYEHCSWALQDLLGIHEYAISIEIRYMNS